MKRAFMVLAACVPVMACADDSLPDPSRAVSPPVGQPTPTFVVFGTVRGEDGRGVAGATADIVAGPLTGRTAVSNVNGYFAFAGVYGQLTIRVYKDGYDRHLQPLLVASDTVIDVKLFRVEVADSIRLGQTIQSTVNEGSEPCDPIRWDARAPCRRFSFTAPRSGLLVIVITWRGDPELDATIVTGDNEYLASSTTNPGEEAWLSASVVANVTYEIRVNSYYTAQVFRLRAELQ